MSTNTISTLSNTKTPKQWGISDSISIPTHPELNRIALKKQIDAEYILWCILRHVTAEHGLSSHFTRHEVYTIALECGLSWTRRHFNRIVADGDGTFWGTDTKHIFIRSFKRVYSALADKQASSVPSSLFVLIKPQKSAAARRAELYWSWFAVRGEQTIARDTLADLFGLSPDQQRDYEALLSKRLSIKSNYCHIDSDLYRKDLKNLPTYSFEFKQEKFIDNRIEYVNVVAYQLPNTYIAANRRDESSLRFAPRRALSVTRRQHWHTLASAYNERCYFDFYDQWEKDMNPRAYIRTYYQGKKRVWRSGHFF